MLKRYATKLFRAAPRKPLERMSKCLTSTATVTTYRAGRYNSVLNTVLIPTTTKGIRFYASSTDGHEIPQEVKMLSDEKYHQEADLFLEDLLDQLETLGEEFPERIPDVELTQGVMTLELLDVGTYVINKQPPNRQIWLSSPVSGPNRFDLYQGEWISLRDGAKLLDILNTEINAAIPEEEVHLKS